MKFGEAFRAIAALQQKSLAGRNLSQLRRQRAGFTRKDEWRETRNLLLGRGQRGRIGIFGQLSRFISAPAFRGPCSGHHHAPLGPPSMIHDGVKGNG